MKTVTWRRAPPPPQPWTQRHPPCQTANQLRMKWTYSYTRCRGSYRDKEMRNCESFVNQFIYCPIYISTQAHISTL